MLEEVLEEVLGEGEEGLGGMTTSVGGKVRLGEPGVEGRRLRLRLRLGGFGLGVSSRGGSISSLIIVANKGGFLVASTYG